MKQQLVTLRYDMLRSTDLEWSLDWRNKSSGTAGDGSTQIVAMGFPRWLGSMKLRLRPEVIGEFQAVRDASQGLLNLWRVPMMDPVLLDRERALRTRPKSLPFGITGGNGPRFAEGPGFQWDPILIAPEGARKGATSILLDGEFLAVGQIVSYDDRPFRILSMRSEAGGKRCTVAPAVRSAIPPGGIVQAVGHGIFQLAEADTGRMGYGLDRVGAPDLSFVEWINR